MFCAKEVPIECSVVHVLPFEPFFDSPLKKVPHSLNEIDILAPVRPDVNITTDSTKPCKVIGIISTGPSLWHITHVIPAPPLTSGVHITVQALGRKVSTRLTCTETLAVGTRVVQCPNWLGTDMWNEGPKTGVVAAVHSNCVYVQWEGSQRQESYPFARTPLTLYSRPHYVFGPSHFQIKTEL